MQIKKIHGGLLCLLALQACDKSQSAQAAPASAAPAFYAQTFSKKPSVKDMTELGRALFFDTALSASGKQSCASCHSPEHAYGPPNDLAAQPGGADMKGAGVRAVPSLRYLQNVPPFTEHYYEADGNDSADQGPAGGHTWDGRADSVHDQARLPLFSPQEMANAGPEEVVAKVRKAAYAPRMRETFGDNVLDDPVLAFKAVLMALEVFQQSPQDFYPYDSKYDAWLRRKAELSEQEARGLALFNNPGKGNCAVCHPSGIREGGFPAFSDFGYVAVGVPRNPQIPANADPAYFDLGLCGPQRTDFKDRKEYCGLFRTPSLRNVATRKVFFHNGSFHSLQQVLEFYAERDSQPQRWYPHSADGSVRKFDDLPEQYAKNVNVEPPFGQQPGGKPALTAAEIRDMIAFLKTLTDGYRPDGKDRN
jgi:cytochrome c peroxidase